MAVQHGNLSLSLSLSLRPSVRWFTPAVLVAVVRSLRNGEYAITTLHGYETGTQSDGCADQAMCLDGSGVCSVASHRELHLATLLSGQENVLKLENALETALQVLYLDLSSTLPKCSCKTAGIFGKPGCSFIQQSYSRTIIAPCCCMIDLQQFGQSLKAYKCRSSLDSTSWDHIIPTQVSQRLDRHSRASHRQDLSATYQLSTCKTAGSLQQGKC